MTTKRGDVVLVVYPDSNLQTAKLRPALVIQADNLNTGLPQVVLAMISSNMVRAGHPSRVSVGVSTPQGQQTGLHVDSVIMTDNLRTVLESQIRHVIGVWSDMAAVDAALRQTLGM
jgi:mRNA interferase MazF